jgi:hypothetical protein
MLAWSASGDRVENLLGVTNKRTGKEGRGAMRSEELASPYPVQ